jgi:methionine-rich copper-binding protein CopC
MSRLLPATFLVALLAAAAFVGGFAPAADAHVRVKATTPKSGATVARSIRSVSVLLTGPIKRGSIRVTGPGGTVYSSGSGGRDPRNTSRLLVKLKSGLPAGRFTARWSIVASDGHSQRGSFSFRLR